MVATAVRGSLEIAPPREIESPDGELDEIVEGRRIEIPRSDHAGLVATESLFRKVSEPPNGGGGE